MDQESEFFINFNMSQVRPPEANSAASYFCTKLCIFQKPRNIALKKWPPNCEAQILRNLPYLKEEEGEV